MNFLNSYSLFALPHIMYVLVFLTIDVNMRNMNEYTVVI